MIDRKIFLLLVVAFFLFSNPFLSQASKSFDFSLLEDAIFETSLENGLKIIILPRHDAPVVSLVTLANVGSSDDPKEYTGLAHMLEHMAFKGTQTIGAKNFKKELELMAIEDKIFAQLRAEQTKGIDADQKLLDELSKKMEKAIDDAYEMIEPNAFSNILEREGGVDLNAYTSRDQTVYHISFPSNKLELWMAMESERFYAPVFREMYKERQVVAEERRMTVDSRPTGKLLEEFLSTAFKAHPYGVPIIGHMSDIMNYSRQSVEEYFKKYYSPANLTIVIVGDVEIDNVMAMTKKYWGRIPGAPVPQRVSTVEPPQISEKRVVIREKSQPVMLMGWHIPQATHADTPAIDALLEILGEGRTSRLYRRMVRDEQVALSASAFSFPGEKYPHIATVYVYPAQGITNGQCEQVVLEEIEKLKTELITEDTL